MLEATNPRPQAHVSLCLSIYLSLLPPSRVFSFCLSIFLINHELTALYIITVCLLHAYTIHMCIRYIRVHESTKTDLFIRSSRLNFYPLWCRVFCLLRFQRSRVFLVSVTLVITQSSPLCHVLLIIFDFVQ